MPMRPRFQLEVSMTPDEVQARLRSRLACAGCPCRAEVLGDHVEVMIRPELQHTWSPRLSLEVRAREGGAVLSGLYGPNPNVWTLFLAAYGVLGLSALFAGMLGVSQLLVGGGTPWGLWLALGCLLACALPYAGSLVGQRLAAEQMELLRCFLAEVLGVDHERATGETCPPAGVGPGRALPLVPPS